MIRVFSVKAYWQDTRRLRREYITAVDEKDALRIVEQKGGYRIRTIYEDFNHLPNKHQLMLAKRYKIDVTDKTKIELRKMIKEHENK